MTDQPQKDAKTLVLEFPPAMLPELMEPHRYKVFYGGRAAGRSWSLARALLYIGMERPTLVLCAREVQRSIKDSVHRLLETQVQLLGMGSFYRVLDNEIRGSNGTEFTFVGLSGQTAESIKSYEGYDICWVEEARSVVESSWKMLIPTIRKENSEIWISFNPELDTDYTFKYFVVDPPPGAVVKKMTWKDNPWFSDTLNTERLHCKRVDPDGYLNIWEGDCLPAVEGAIYYRQLATAEAAGHVCRVPYDPMLKVHVVLDLGFGHNMSAAMVQKHLSEIRIIDYIQVQGYDLNNLTQELHKRKYNWGRVWLPHDGFSRDHKEGKTSQSILQALGWDVPNRPEITELSVEEGIRLVKLKFPQIVFDSTRCGPVIDKRHDGGMLYGGLLECIKRYRRKLNRATGTFTTPSQDQYTDGADCLRYVVQNADSMLNIDIGSAWDEIANIKHEDTVDYATAY
jgi:phage terminase large subunit